MQLFPESSVAIFDSGFGGLTVMKAIRGLLPSENIIYLADTARFPYGSKSKDLVLRYSIENISFLIQQPIKTVVVACNTVCCFALEALQKKFPISIIGVTLPAVEAVARNSLTKKVAIVGTRGTILSQEYQKLFRLLLPSATVVPIPCQILVHLIEEGYARHPITTTIIEEYLSPLRSQLIDTLILGCTHFPIVGEKIKKKLGKNIRVINPAPYCAQALKRSLAQQGLLNPASAPPQDQFFVSDDQERFKLLGSKLLGYPIQNIYKKKFQINPLKENKNLHPSEPKNWSPNPIFQPTSVY